LAASLIENVVDWIAERALEFEGDVPGTELVTMGANPVLTDIGLKPAKALNFGPTIHIRSIKQRSSRTVYEPSGGGA
jgi:hypothetical protein